MTTRVAHRCQTCGLVLEPDDTGKWCDSCQPSARSGRRAKADPYDALARQLVEQGLASDLVVDRTHTSAGKAS
jgi:hypothetical protein